MATESTLKEGRRAPGSEWLKNHPRWLETAYKFTEKLFLGVYPVLGRVRFLKRLMVPAESLSKGYLFNCQMCGQCVLHSTGMTCPMTCPKNLRNGPCGGVRANGNCEVIPDLPCIWVQSWERSQQMTLYSDEMKIIQPPVNRALHNTSSWVNMAEGVDTVLPVGWQQASGKEEVPE